MTNTLTGVLIMLVSTSMMNIGMVLQKKAVDQMPPLESQGLVTSFRLIFATPLWLFGWVLTTLAIVLNMVALGFADISIIQPLNGFGMVVLVLFSRLYLGERLTSRVLLGIGAAILGVVLIGSMAGPSRTFAGVEEILAGYRQTSGVLVLLAFAAVMVVAGALASRNWEVISGILFAFVAACSSVVGLTLSKGLFAMFTTVGVGPTLSTWPSYLLLVLGLSFAVAALFVQQLSFQKGRAVVVTPVFSASSVVLPLAMGRMVFGETINPYTMVAIASVVIGVVLLGSREAPHA